MDLDGVKDIVLYHGDLLFENAERGIICGSSSSGKTHLTENLVRKYAHRFHKIVICGNRNKLLDFPETKHLSELYEGDDVIYDPFRENDVYDLKKKHERDNKYLLLILDDLMETVCTSHTVSKIYSKGRHCGISILILTQSYFPTGQGSKNVFIQIKNNTTFQIFTKTRSYGEINNIASRMECDKRGKEFFLSLFNKYVQEGRYGYLMVSLDVSDGRLRYSNNILGEDGTGLPTIHPRRQ